MDALLQLAAEIAQQECVAESSGLRAADLDAGFLPEPGVDSDFGELGEAEETHGEVWTGLVQVVAAAVSVVGQSRLVAGFVVFEAVQELVETPGEDVVARLEALEEVPRQVANMREELADPVADGAA